MESRCSGAWHEAIVWHPCLCVHRERHEGLAARTKSLPAGTPRRALVAVAADSQVAVMDAETGFTLSK